MVKIAGEMKIHNFPHCKCMYSIGFSAFQEKNSRLSQSLMLLQRTAVAVNMVKLKTLVRTITLACNGHTFLTISLCEHNI